MIGGKLVGIGNKIKNAVGIEGNTWEYIRPIIGYNVANITIGGVTEPINKYHQQFLNFVEGMDTRMTGTISTIGGVIDAITDLAMGFITDRTKSKLGKHRVWIITALPILLLGFFMKWYSFGISSTGNTTALFWYYLLASLIYSSGYTMMNIPHQAMLPTIAPRYFERTQYKIVEYIFNMFGMFPSFIFMSIVLGGTNMGNPSPADRNKYLICGLVFLVYFFWSPLVTFFTTKEKSSADMENPPLDIMYFIREYIQVFKNKAFRQYFLINMFYGFSRSFYNYADQFFIRSIADKYSHFAMLNTVGGAAEIAGGPFNYFLVRYIDKRTCGFIMAPLMITGLLINGFVTPATPVFVIYIATILYNFGFSGPGFVVNNIQPDVTDVDELITGRRREGVITTFYSFVKKTINSFVNGILGYSMFFFGYDTTAANYSDLTTTAEFGIRLIVSWLPAAFAILSLVLIFAFKMKKKDHELIQAVIKEKHETGTCTITESDKKKLEEIAGQRWEDMWIGQGAVNRKLEELANI